jgi:uncharacterized protein (TIGR02270 family)
VSQPPDTVLPTVVELHAAEAGLLWPQRDRGVRSPHFSLRQLDALDERLEAHLDALRLAGDFGWELCGKGLEEGGSGDVFAAAVLAFESGAADRTRLVVEKGPTAPPRVRALASALGWLPFARVKGAIAKLAEPGPVPVRYAGIAAAAAHRRQDIPVSRALSGDPWLDARLFRATGELGLTDARATLHQGLKHEKEACRFWAAWSGTLVHNDPGAQAVLQSVAESGGPFAERAAELLGRRLQPHQVNRWRQRLADLPNPRPAVRAAEAAGAPDAVPWLIEQMRRPPLARIAGEAFESITGARIAYDNLEGTQPEGFEAGPNDNPADDNVALDEDDDLPWPDPERVAAWWRAHQGRFSQGTRYLLGQPLSPEALRLTLRQGFQRQRAAAALELAVQQPGQPLFEVRAPGFRQLHLLGSERKP